MPDIEPDDRDEDLKSAQRMRWTGRLIVIGFGLLLLVYIVPMVLSVIHGRAT